MELLAGVRVLEVSHYWPDSVGQYLADLGAYVVKVEHPTSGSLSRGLHCFDGLDIPHLVWNRGKHSLGLDLKAAGGRDLFLDLAREADIVVEGMRAGALTRLRLEYETLARANPRIVLVSMNGWGEDGPYRHLGTNGAGFDAYAGLQPAARRSDGLAEMPDVAGTRGECHYAVLVGGLHAALAAVAAYVQSQKTGKGAHVEVAQGDAAAACMFDRLFYLLNAVRGRPIDRSAHTRYQYYATGDGKAIFLSPGLPEQWSRFCRAVGRPDLLDSEAGTDHERRAVADIVRTRSRDEWIELCLEHDIPAAPVHDGPEDLLADPHFQARDLVASYPDEQRGSVRMFSTPVKVAASEFVARRAPQIGGDTDPVLEAFGIPQERVRALREAGTIN